MDRSSTEPKRVSLPLKNIVAVERTPVFTVTPEDRQGQVVDTVKSTTSGCTKKARTTSDKKPHRPKKVEKTSGGDSVSHLQQILQQCVMSDDHSEGESVYVDEKLPREAAMTFSDDEDVVIFKRAMSRWREIVEEKKQAEVEVQRAKERIAYLEKQLDLEKKLNDVAFRRRDELYEKMKLLEKIVRSFNVD